MIDRVRKGLFCVGKLGNRDMRRVECWLEKFKVLELRNLLKFKDILGLNIEI